MIKGKLKRQSIGLKLFLASLAVFIAMVLLSNFLIRLKQEEMMNKFTEGVAESLAGTDQENISLTLVINEARIRETGEYQAYVAGILLATILLGGLVFAWVISRILGPLRNLTDRIKQVDIDSIPSARKQIELDNASKELRDLSQSFQIALDRIYENYEKQRQFSVNVAHELRTPLAVLRTKIDVFKRQNKDLDPEIKAFVDTMEHNSHRLYQLVDQVMLLSRDLEANFSQVAVEYLIEEIFLDLEDRAREAEVGLELEDGQLLAWTDDILLERVLYNLLDNAIKYSLPQTTCRVKLFKQDDRALIQVIDSGPGLTDAEKKKVFDLFYRSDESRARKTGGYGVGLALVKDLVNRLSGEIKIYDNEPSGCIFEVSLPTTEASV